MVFDDITAGHI